MKLKITNLLLVFILSVGFASAQFTTDGIYTIENVGNPKFMNPQKNGNSIITMTAGTADDFKWIIKQNGNGYNIITEDGLWLASSDGSKGLLIANDETNRNSATSGALVTFTEVNDANTNPYLFESTFGDVLKVWNGQRGTNTQVGMGGSATSTKYNWNLTRLGDIPTGDVISPVLTVTSPSTIEPGDDITYTANEDAKVYLVPSGTTGDLAAIQAAAVASVDAFATSGTLATSGLSFGDYVLYAIDNLDNLGASGGTISIIDLSFPSGSVSASTVVINESFSVTINKDGDVYVVPAGTAENGDRETLAVATAAATAATAVSISTATGFTEGSSYDVWAKDTGGNWSPLLGTVAVVEPSLPGVWTFDTDGDAEGWNPGNTAVVDGVAGGALTWSWGAHNAPKLTKAGLSLPTSDYKKILVRLKNPNDVDVTSSNSARVVTTTDGGAGTKFFSFIHTSNDTDFHTYIIDPDPADDGAKYSGTLTSVQIQGLRGQEVPGGTLSMTEFRVIRDDNTWTGTVSTEWNEAGNWSNNIVPTGEIVIIPAVTNQPVISTEEALVADMTLEEGAIVTVSSNQTLTVLRDVLAPGTASGYLDIADGSSLIIYGELQGSAHLGLGDLVPPVLTVTSASSIEPGDDVTYTSDENAKVYLVPAGTTGDLAAIKAAALASVETPATSGTLSTTGLAFGDYILFAEDDLGNLGSSGGTTTLADLTAPTGSVSATTVIIKESFTVTIDEIGTIYVVPAGTAAGDIETAQVATEAAVASTAVSISTASGFSSGSSYDVYAKDASGNWSANLGTVVVSAPLSAGNMLEMRVYPNPAFDRIKVDAVGLVKLQLLDLGGRILLEKGRNSVLNVENFKNGLYFLKVYTIAGTEVRKIMINQ